MATLNRLSRHPEEEPEVRTAVAPAVQSAQLTRILALQRSAGNAAMSGLLAREPAPAATASPVANLASRAGSAPALRAMLVANPALAMQIASYFATGVDDPALNELMTQAFSPVAPSEAQAPAAKTDKDPTDTALPLPAAISDEKKLDKGHMKWTLKPENHSSARADIDFKPDETKVEAKTVSFGQSVVSHVGSSFAYAGGTATDPGKNKAKFEPFEEAATKKRMDHAVDTENDPFYGAEWDQSAKRWKQERAAWAVGSSKKGASSTSATMFDTPSAPEAREGLGDVSHQFETVPMVLETRQPLGALTWGYKIKDAENSPIELTGGTQADCVDTPSASWSAAMDQFYIGKFEEILDDFEIAKADLKPDHETKLDGIVTKMKANVALKAQLGGAADLTGDAKFNQALSLKRARAARNYLVAKGIDAGRLEVQSYGADWARVEAEPGQSEGKNRRVQIWLR